MKKIFSILVPCFNEQGNVGPLVESIVQHCAPYQYEIIAINDGSTDDTLTELHGLKSSTPSLKIIDLKRNFGQTAAMAAGIDHAAGDVIIIMDGDQQNDPADIPRLIAKLEEGYDVVSGWRKSRKDSFLNRRLPSMIANGIIATFTGVRIHDFGCTLKAYRKSIIKDLQLYGEMHRFIPAWCAWQGGRVAEIEVNHRPRTIGKSKYGIFRIVKVLIDLSTLKFFSSYLSKPNYLFSGTGLICFLISVFSAGFAVYDKLGPDHHPRLRIPLLLLSVGFGMIAVFFLLMGLLAELLVKIYFQNGNCKPYRVKDEEVL
jgi:glycosyltransferase involved in cell wall biosynthesis